MRRGRWVLTVLLVFWGVLGPHGVANGGGGGVPDFESVIGGFIQGTADLGDLQAAIEGQPPQCSLPDDSGAIALKQLYDTFVFLGSLLCKLRITCALDPRVLKDFFPLPANTSVLPRIFAESTDALILGRWYHLYAPMIALDQAYRFQLGWGRALGDLRPFAIVVFPDIRVGEERAEVIADLLKEAGTGASDASLAAMKALGDRDHIEKLANAIEKRVLEASKAPSRIPGLGDLTWQVLIPGTDFGKSEEEEDEGIPMKLVAIPWANEFPPEESGAKVKEVAMRVAEAVFPGVVITVPVPGSGQPGHTFLLLGASLPQGSPIEEYDPCQGGTPGGLMLEFVGRVPYFWNALMGMVLPVVRTVVTFSEAMEAKEKGILPDKKGGSE